MIQITFSDQNRIEPKTSNKKICEKSLSICRLNNTHQNNLWAKKKSQGKLDNSLNRIK